MLKNGNFPNLVKLDLISKDISYIYLLLLIGRPNSTIDLLRGVAAIAVIAKIPSVDNFDHVSLCEQKIRKERKKGLVSCMIIQEVQSKFKFYQ